MAGPGFYETFKPQDIVPLALRAHELKLRKDQLDLLTQEHTIKMKTAAQQVEARETFKNWMSQTEKSITGMGDEDVGIGEGGGSQITETPKKRSAEEILNYMLQSGVGKPEDIGKTLATLTTKEHRAPTDVEALIGGGGVTAEQTEKFIAGKQAIQKPTKETKFDLQKKAALGDKGAQIQLEKIIEMEGKGEPYKVGHIQPFESKEGGTIYKEYTKDANGNAEWVDRPDLGGKIPPKGFNTMEEAVSEAKRVNTATKSGAALIPTAELGMGNKWIPKLVPNIELRIPPFQQGAALPPGIIFNRKTGKYTDSTSGQEMSREKLTTLYGERAMLDADKSALRDLSKRYELISIFANRIDANVPIVKEASKLVNNTDARLYNAAINKSKQFLLGSGQWAALQTSLLALSNEVQRIESNSLGIGGQGQEERKVWAKIHDPNLSFKDLDILLDMITKLSKTAKGAVNKQRIDLFNRIPEEAKGEFGISLEETPTQTSTTQIEPRKPGESITNYLKRTQE